MSLFNRNNPNNPNSPFRRNMDPTTALNYDYNGANVANGSAAAPPINSEYANTYPSEKGPATGSALAQIGLFANIRADCAAALLEFIGTFFFLLLGLGGIQASAAEAANGTPAATTLTKDLYIATCMGFSLLVSAWLFYRVTGGLFNPNISLALLLVGVIGPVRFVLYCIAQLLGAIAASAVVLALTPGPLMSNTFLQQGINPAQGVFIEMFITTALVIAVLMLAAEKHQATAFAPVGIGLTLFACHLFAVFYTGAGMNTARSFGPAVVTGFPYGTQWVYWLGPFLGSLLGALFYSVLKHYRYWMLNPDQATADPRKSPDDPIIKARTIVNSSPVRAGTLRGRGRTKAESDAGRVGTVSSFGTGGGPAAAQEGLQVPRGDEAV